MYEVKEESKLEKQALLKYVYQKYGLHFHPLLKSQNNQLLSLFIKNHPFVILDSQGLIMDIKCPRFAQTIMSLPYFSQPQLIKDSQEEWVEVQLSKISDHDLHNLLDYAFKAASDGSTHFVEQQLIYLPDDQIDSEYSSQKIPSHASNQHLHPIAPQALEKMIKSYDYTKLPAESQSYNFYHQGKMVADYNDHYTQIYELKQYFPDYHSMNVRQLRTYFTWRTQLRQGNFTVSSTSYAYVYIYELLNNIGVSTPQEGFEKLTYFRDHYADSYDKRMHVLLSRWLRDYVLFYGLGRAAANDIFGDEIIIDRGYHILRHPDEYSASQLQAVLKKHCSYIDNCRLAQKSPHAWSNIVSVIWKALIHSGIDVMSSLVASRVTTSEYFFSSAVFYFHQHPLIKDYPIDSERIYHCHDRQYFCERWCPLKDQGKRLNAFFHEIDRLIRQKYRLGRPLKPRKIDSEILGIIAKTIDEYQIHEQRQHQPKIKINLGSLGKIRQDASVTRDSLLTDEEKTEADETPVIENEQKLNPATAEQSESNNSSSLLNENQLYFIQALLKGQSYQDYLRKHHLMDSILADDINEELFDEIGDNVIEFNGQGKPVIIEDYRDDLEKLLQKGEN